MSQRTEPLSGWEPGGWLKSRNALYLGMIRSCSRMGQVGLFQGQERGTSSYEDRARAGELTELKLCLEELQFEGRAWCPSRIQQWQSTVQAGSSSRQHKIKKHPSACACVVRGFRVRRCSQVRAEEPKSASG